MKILFTDLDETLLNEYSEISDYTKSVLDRFTAAGNKLVLSSGRPLNSVLEVKEKAGLNYPGTYVISYNGCLIYDCDAKKSIRDLRVPMDYVNYVQSAADRQNLHIQTYSASEVITHIEDEEIKFYRKRIHLPLVLADQFSEVLTQEPLKLLAIHLTDHSKLEAFVDSIKDWASDKLQLIFSTPRYLEIFHIDGGKGSAVRYLCDYLNIPIENSYAAGDAENDISMLEAAGCGIAMLNGDDKVKAIADVITEFDNTKDGLAHFLENCF